MLTKKHESRTPIEVLDIKEYKDAQEAILRYGEDPSMLYNMTKKDRGEYAKALIEACEKVGMKSSRLPPLWIGILSDPDLHDTLAKEYLSS